MIFKKIDAHSLDALPIGLDFFDMPVTNVAIEKAYEREFLPLNPINVAPYTFKLNTGTAYMDPKSLRLLTTIKVTAISETGAEINLEKKHKIALVNGVGACYPRNLRVIIGGQLSSDSNNLYPYKVDIDNALNFSEDSKKSSMNMFGFYYDNGKKSLIVGSKAFEKRQELFYDGKEAEFIAPLYADICQQPNFLPSNLDIDIEIIPEDEKFLVVAPNLATTELNTLKLKGVKVRVTSVRLYATFYDLQPNVALEIEKKLAAGETFKYPMRRTEIRFLNYDYQKQLVSSTVFHQTIPRTLVVVLILKSKFNGQLFTDPTDYTDVDLNYIEIHAGNLKVPNVQFNMNFGQEKIARGFEHLHRTLGIAGNNVDCGINRDMFLDGYTIWPFNLTSSLQDDETFDFIRDGPTILNMKFNSDIPEGGIMCIVMGQWDAIMYIDQTRTVRTDLSI